MRDIEIVRGRSVGPDYLNVKAALWVLPSISFTTSSRQLPTQVLSVFQTLEDAAES
jgi:hypothetical protein